MLPAEAGNRSVLIVSEKLSSEGDDFTAIPANHMVLVYQNLSVKLVAFEVV
jgi:hypothetical protein